MHEALTGLVDTADLALAAVRDAVGDSELDPVARLITDARIRMDYPEDAVVAALAGGTGSGKSSLFNELTGTDAAAVGEIRPTTSEPLVAVPERYAHSFDGYLDLLGIDRRITHPEPGICLIDLPDTDSVVVANRHRVEEVMPRIDVLVWVVDPEKYRDAALHHRYLRPLAAYSSQFLFVLNKVDRLASEDVGKVVADLVSALRDDGIKSPTIVTTAVPPGLPASGVDDLVAALRGTADQRHTLYRKLITDMGHAAIELERAVGSPIGYRSLMMPVVEGAAELVARGSRREAVETLSLFIDDVAARVGGQAARQLTELSATIPERVDRAVAAVGPRPGGGWWGKRTTVPESLPIEQARREVELILAPVTAVMTSRARALALVAELAVGAARLDLLVDAGVE